MANLTQAWNTVGLVEVLLSLNNTTDGDATSFVGDLRSCEQSQRS